MRILPEPILDYRADFVTMEDLFRCDVSTTMKSKTGTLLFVSAISVLVITTKAIDNAPVLNPSAAAATYGTDKSSFTWFLRQAPWDDFRRGFVKNATALAELETKGRFLVFPCPGTVNGAAEIEIKKCQTIEQVLLVLGYTSPEQGRTGWAPSYD